MLRRVGPFDDGLDLCCGTGAGVEVLTKVCQVSVTGVDFSTGMLEVARERVPSGGPRVSWVRGDARALPFASAFDLVVSFGAFGHFLPRELPGLFDQVHSVLRPGGCFAFPVVAPPRPTSPAYWMLSGFDAVMKARNAVWRPPFVMYYRDFQLGLVGPELERAGFAVDLYAPARVRAARRRQPPRPHGRGATAAVAGRSGRSASYACWSMPGGRPGVHAWRRTDGRAVSATSCRPWSMVGVTGVSVDGVTCRICCGRRRHCRGPGDLLR